MPLHPEQPNPWSREAQEQRSSEQFVPHPTETFGGKPVLNVTELDALEDRVYVNLYIPRGSDRKMDPGWTQKAEGFSSLSEAHRPLMLMEKLVTDENGREMIATKWVDMQAALEHDAAHREQLRQAAQASLAHEAIEAVGVAAPAVEIDNKPETDVEMYERFVRESQAELSALYAQHRAVSPHSNEAATLENQISHAKADIGEYSRKLARLKGSQVWH